MPGKKKFYIEKSRLVAMVQRVQNGEANLDDEIYEAFHDKFYGRIFKKIKDHDATEQLLNDVFLQIGARIHSLNVPEAFVTWSNQIVDRTCAAYYRKKYQAEKRREKAEKMTASAKTRRRKLSDQEKDVLEVVLKALPSKHAMVMSLHYIDGKPVRQIAEELDIPIGTVKSRLHYGRKEFNSRLEKNLIK